MKALALWGGLLLAVAAAQGVEWTEEWFATNSDWRAVGGVIYNTAHSSKWEWMDAEVTGTHPSKPLLLILEAQPVHIRGAWYSTNYVAHALKNMWKPTGIGWALNVRVMWVGTVEYKGRTVQLYDCGTTPTAEEIEKTRKRLGYPPPKPKPPTIPKGKGKTTV